MKILFRKLRTAAKFSRAEWRILGTAYYFLLKARLLLFFFSSQTVKRALAQNSLSPSSRTFRRAGFPLKSDQYRAENLPHKEKYLCRLFRIAWRYQIGETKCLPTSLAKSAFLEHFGFSHLLRIGINKKNGKLLAHAWCENERISLGYQPLEIVDR